MKTKLSLLVLVLGLGCATVPAHVSARREASARLESCLGWNVGHQPSPSERRFCLQESAAFCQSQGLSDGCGSSDLWTRNYTRY